MLLCILHLSVCKYMRVFVNFNIYTVTSIYLACDFKPNIIITFLWVLDKFEIMILHLIVI